MHTPNLFYFAGSELSQDAFICWLLSWAKAEHAGEDESLHQCALGFIGAMLKKHGVTEPVKSVEVKKQYKNIDVLCIINEKYAIVIEDKTGTKNHSGQLLRYTDEIKKEGKYEEKNILGVYYKTEDQSNYEDVESKGYKTFLRRDLLLPVLGKYEGHNDIMISYREHIKTIDHEVESYETLPLDQWLWRSWKGFYLALQKDEWLGKGEWGYVPNPSGGFLGFWWSWKGNEKCRQYLQLEQRVKENDSKEDDNEENENRVGILCFKIEVDDESEQKTLRDKWHEAIMKKGENHPMLKLKKPPRFGSGRTMTVCIHDNDYRAANEKNVIDMEKTVELIRSAMTVLDAAAEGSAE